MKKKKVKNLVLDLKELIGLSVKEAEKLVKSYGLEPETWPEGQITPAITLEKNIVRLYYDKKNIVVSAKTQESIDAKYK
jgi:hypothetical protein